MRRIALFGIVAACLAGCGPKAETTYTDGRGNSVTSTSDGTKVTATDSSGKTTTMETSADGKVKVESENGKSSYESGATVSESELGLPTYPGGKMVANSPQKVTDEKSTTYIVSMTTSDEPSKVAEFYKSKITSPQSASSNTDGGVMESLNGKLADGSEMGLIAIRNKGESETTLTLTVKHDKK